ncbi:peptide-methionine (S)-S-oxide reductase MsrA [Kamptonema cortianum]|nr:peptide-methionine (S)-S-oxide reductase MsrA [Geitlerinema splendidum]MDK3157632.1 peptide-methionine (S)-S-oxide reductase MsrA [Kamptonema cortianum]
MVAGGCFWGTEYYLRQMNGVVATAVGYIGGKTDNPTYKEVCYEGTGHAEAVMVEFDANVVSYSAILDRFWQIHNPCTWNRQGPDIGSQYRSAIFYLNDEQKSIAEKSKKDAQKLFRRPIVTLIEKAPRFWMAEEYHQQYAEKTGKTSCPIDRSDHKDGS